MGITCKIIRGELMRKGPKVAIIIPAYNESSVLGDVIVSVRNALRNSAYKADIIVVNDGSRDNTSQVARDGGAIVIDHILNSGAGSATATGLDYASQNNYDIAATMDADGQHLPVDVVTGLDQHMQNKADLLIGSRLMDADGMSSVKIIGNRGLSFITLILFGIRSTDSQSGLRIFSRHALETLRWRTSGYEFCSEMLWRAKQIGLNVDEYPIKAVYTEYSSGKGQNNWNGVNIVKSLLKRRIAELFG